MKKFLILASALVISPAWAGELSVCFTPGQDCQAQIVLEIAQAKNSIQVQAYGFTAKPISQALKAAHKRGVVVQVILDKSNLTARDSRAAALVEAGVSVFLDLDHATAHNKVMLIDGVVVTGSYNFTKSAQVRNAENVLFIRGG